MRSILCRSKRSVREQRQDRRAARAAPGSTNVKRVADHKVQHARVVNSLLEGAARELAARKDSRYLMQRRFPTSDFRTSMSGFEARWALPLPRGAAWTRSFEENEELSRALHTARSIALRLARRGIASPTFRDDLVRLLSDAREDAEVSVFRMRDEENERRRIGVEQFERNEVPHGLAQRLSREQWLDALEIVSAECTEGVMDVDWTPSMAARLLLSADTRASLRAALVMLRRRLTPRECRHAGSVALMLASDPATVLSGYSAAGLLRVVPSFPQFDVARVPIADGVTGPITDGVTDGVTDGGDGDTGISDGNMHRWLMAMVLRAPSVRHAVGTFALTLMHARVGQSDLMTERCRTLWECFFEALRSRVGLINTARSLEMLPYARDLCVQLDERGDPVVRVDRGSDGLESDGPGSDRRLPAESVLLQTLRRQLHLPVGTASDKAVVSTGTGTGAGSTADQYQLDEVDTAAVLEHVPPLSSHAMEQRALSAENVADIHALFSMCAVLWQVPRPVSRSARTSLVSMARALSEQSVRADESSSDTSLRGNEFRLLRQVANNQSPSAEVASASVDTLLRRLGLQAEFAQLQRAVPAD